MLLCRRGPPHARTRDTPHERRATGGLRASAAGSVQVEVGTDDANGALCGRSRTRAHLDAGTLTASSTEAVSIVRLASSLSVSGQGRMRIAWLVRRVLASRAAAARLFSWI